MLAGGGIGIGLADVEMTVARMTARPVEMLFAFIFPLLLNMCINIL
jgi:hypothetical protein